MSHLKSRSEISDQMNLKTRLTDQGKVCEKEKKKNGQRNGAESFGRTNKNRNSFIIRLPNFVVMTGLNKN
jgi:hypothetical protein